MSTSVVIGRSGRHVDTSGEVWKLRSATAVYTLNWNAVTVLPTFVLAAARSHVREMMQVKAPTSVNHFFNRSLRGLVRCQTIRQLPDVLTERTFEELAELLENDHAALHWYRDFYCWAALFDYPGFDTGTAEVLHNFRIGGSKSPDAVSGRNPGLSVEQYRWLLDAISRAPESVLDLKEKIALELALLFGSNAGPLSLLRGSDSRLLTEGKQRLWMPRHKKGDVEERLDFRPRPISDRLAADIAKLVDRNKSDVSKMTWSDGSLGCPRGVEIPIFVRKQPRLEWDTDSKSRAYAVHMFPDQISYLLKRAVEKLALADGIVGPHVSARTLRRTVLTEMRQAGLPDEYIADLADHSSTRYVDNYAYGDWRVVRHLDRTVGPLIAAVSAPVDRLPPAVDAGLSAELLLRKPFGTALLKRSPHDTPASDKAVLV